MSVISRQSGQRVETAELPKSIDPDSLSKLEGAALMPREEMEDGSQGRIYIDSESDVLPASDEIASLSPKAARDVAAFLLSTVCGWRSRQIGMAIGYKGAASTTHATLAARRGQELIAKGVVRRS